MEIREVPLDRLIPSRLLRTESSDVDVTELAESIREHGLMQPIVVRPVDHGMFQIIAGYRRFKAHRALHRDTITAVIEERDDEAAAAQSIVENLQRENLTPLELAHAIRELGSGFNLSPDAIARLISKSPSQVRTWTRLSRLPDDILQRLESGERGTQSVRGLAARHLAPFVADLPVDEETEEAKAKWSQRVAEIRRFQDEVERRADGVHVNAHMADAIARATKGGAMTIEEAVEQVLAAPESYRFRAPIASADELQLDTFGAYQEILTDIMAQTAKLRPEIAVSFTNSQKRWLLERWNVHLEAALPYLEALRRPSPGDGDGEARALSAGEP